MKRNIYIIAIFVLVAFSACKKYLATVPQSFLPPASYYQGSNLTNAIAAIYSPLGSFGGASLYNENVVGIFTCNDETFIGGPGRAVASNNVAALGYDYSTGNINNFWKGCYTGIERANELLSYVDPKDPSADVQAAYGEALFLRAYYHFLLVSNFGDVPLKITPTTSPEGLQIARTPTIAVYEQILADMKAAENRVYPINKLNHASRVSKSAVDGILARVYLYMAGYPLNGGKGGAAAMYDSSLTYSQKVINSGLHSLNPSYSQIFINNAANIFDVKESIWEVGYSGNDGAIVKAGSTLGSQNGIPFSFTNVLPGSINQVFQDSGYSYGYIYVNQKLYNLYDSCDARRDWNVANFNYAVSTTTLPYVTRVPISNTTVFSYNKPNAKWRRNYENFIPKGKNTSAINFPILRYADVLLMFAEADLQVNGGSCTPAGVAAVNAVRERGYGLTATTAPLKSLNLINGGSGYNTTITNNYNNASIADVNLGNWLGCASTITGGAVTAVKLTSGGLGFTPASAATIYLGTPWAANTTYTVNKQVINNGNLYTVTTAGNSTATPPAQTSGASSAAVTGAVFTYAGVAATASGTLLTAADVDKSAITLKDIQDERSRELCYEGTRKGDLVRWNIFYPTMLDVFNQMNAWPTYAINTKANAITGYSNVASGLPFKHLLLPIPSSEMSVNKNVTQNPGW
ncbi:RagB/SusD family nutrient uptake outer membrane protein [Pinibacter aurantiacus]|uniref:RagB/SusD family nutrient uptake outer membrane protein n=1 Tax=Pinibacter aurantiacus TaxID=2851599 RepID=A0A9E2SDY5_9BACT|nr:RagB/SusD family nutrient uptake outer membrane protein [Pinibacter aurantiacus]MBV4358195.1 RagB/SusD family nutrient uptake outer membrane protein [Pinibacter aurantiacus]